MDLIQRPVRFLPRIERVNNSISSSIYFLLDIHNNIYLYFKKLRTENAILFIHERKDSNFLFQNIEKLRTENAILFIRDEGFEFSISKYRSRKCICISIRVLKNTQLSSASIRE